ISDDGQSLSEQLRRIGVAVGSLADDQQEVWATLRQQLVETGIVLVDAARVSGADRTWLDSYFLDAIVPAITPLAIDPAHPFPFIPNLGLTVALQLSRKVGGKRMTALMRMPSSLDRFVRLPVEDGAPDRFIALDQLVTLYVTQLFPSYAV